ncbi:hypothetical protein OG921_23335 [Aldersonia sp. NBC_00410]|uniref:hypothetical protein n=1 Tax=Aldersonia sp. NBC_00410 TaxID=2975954 RepID=UPI002256A493|nr:hypothetical protein [Aldersonia sp. NBC_00410]MCX5046108.1 hypothetical protein [Aldersonia sp. NBC_00410]
MNYFHDANDVQLDNVLGGDLAYDYDGTTTFQLRINGAVGGSNGFSSLVWEPLLNGGGGPNWADADSLKNGQWWSTRDIGGLASGQNVSPRPTATLQEIAAANPDAYVTQYGVLLGGSGASPAATGHADAIRFGCDRWNFEPGPFSASTGGSGGSSGSGN